VIDLDLDNCISRAVLGHDRRLNRQFYLLVLDLRGISILQKISDF